MSGERNGGWAGDTGTTLAGCRGGRSPSWVVMIPCSTPSLHSGLIPVQSPLPTAGMHVSKMREPQLPGATGHQGTFFPLAISSAHLVV